VRRDSHPIAAAGRAAPAPCMVLGRVVKEGAASGIRASFDEREVSVTEQIAGRLRDRHHQLLGLVQIKPGHFLEAPRAPCLENAGRPHSNRFVNRFK
jgi:hypothetical protein